MIKIECKNKVDSLIVTGGRLDIPLVVINKGDRLMGFVPALNIESIWDEVGKEEEIILKLKERAKEKVKQMANAGEAFPFFPDRASINYEFSPVRIDFLVAHIGKSKK